MALKGPSHGKRCQGNNTKLQSINVPHKANCCYHSSHCRLKKKKKKKSTSLIPCGKFGWPYLGKATTAARAALPIPNSACGIFVCPNKRYGCQCLGSLTCAQMLVHAIAHEGCTDTVGESALKVDSGRKIPCRTGESNLPQRRAGSKICQLSYIPTKNACSWCGCNVFIEALRMVVHG